MKYFKVCFRHSITDTLTKYTCFFLLYCLKEYYLINCIMSSRTRTSLDKALILQQPQIHRSLLYRPTTAFITSHQDPKATTKYSIVLYPGGSPFHGSISIRWTRTFTLCTFTLYWSERPSLVFHFASLTEHCCYLVSHH